MVMIDDTVNLSDANASNIPADLLLIDDEPFNLEILSDYFLDRLSFMSETTP